MAITFVARGTQYKPYYAADTTFDYAGNAPSAPIVDAGAIGGFSFDLGAAGTLSQHRIHYNGIGNWPGTKAVSILMRFYAYNLASTLPLFVCSGSGRAGSFGYGGFEARVDATNFVIGMADDNALTGINSVTFAHGGLSTATYYDLFITFTGDTTSNGCQVFLNSSSLGTTTSSRSWNATRVKNFNGMTFGSSNNVVNTYIRVNEFVLWDTIESPSSILLTSGIGSLNGASRAAFVDSVEYDGLAPSTGGRIIKSL